MTHPTNSELIERLHRASFGYETDKSDGLYWQAKSALESLTATLTETEADLQASRGREDALLAEQKRLRAAVANLTVNPRDEYHSMTELYDYRMLYNALAFNAWAALGTHPVVKSWRHSDGELCFGGGWFIVTATLPTGLISNHYRDEHWDLFQIPEAIPPEFDGHTPGIAAQRMRDLAASDDSSLTLDAAKAAAWDEGFDAGEADVFQHEEKGWTGGHGDNCMPNPYRPVSTEGESRE